jgi:plastocyanin
MSWSIGIRRSLVFGAVGALMAGCGGGGGNLSEPADPVFTSLSLTASPTVLFTRAPGNTSSLTARALDQSGNEMNGLGLPDYTSDHPGVATVEAAGVVRAVNEGSTTIRASLTAGGITRTASVVISVTEGELTATVTAPALSFLPASVDIARGGTVTWTLGTVPHNVTFTTLNAPDDIPTWSEGSNSRTFPGSGTFSYQCTVHAGMSGAIVVH